VDSAGTIVGVETLSSGGIARGMTVLVAASNTCRPAPVASGTTIAAAARGHIGGGSAVGMVLQSGGTLTVLSGGNVQLLSVGAGATATIGSGVTWSGTVVDAGGVLNVAIGGTAAGTTDLGSETVSSGGAASGTTVGAGGTLTLLAARRTPRANLQQRRDVWRSVPASRSRPSASTTA